MILYTKSFDYKKFLTVNKSVALSPLISWCTSTSLSTVALLGCAGFVVCNPLAAEGVIAAWPHRHAEKILIRVYN